MERSGKRDVATPERPYLFRSHRDYFGAVRLAMTHAFVDSAHGAQSKSPSPAIRKTDGNGTDGRARRRQFRALARSSARKEDRCSNRSSALHYDSGGLASALSVLARSALRPRLHILSSAASMRAPGARSRAWLASPRARRATYATHFNSARRRIQSANACHRRTACSSIRRIDTACNVPLMRPAQESFHAALPHPSPRKVRSAQ